MKYLKRAYRGSVEAQFDCLSLKAYARFYASQPAGARVQREALAWLRKKCPARARQAEQVSQETTAGLERRARQLEVRPEVRHG